MPDESPSFKITAVGIGITASKLLKMLKDEHNGNVETVMLAHVDSNTVASEADKTVKIGYSMRGLGACPDPGRWKGFAESSEREIREAIGSSDAIFLVGDAGDDLVAGALPEVAKYSREKSKLIISLLRYPFDFEGKKIGEFAEYCVHNSRESSDAVIVLRVQNISRLIGRIPIDAVFEVSNFFSSSIVSTLMLPFINGDLRLISEITEMFRNSFGEPAIGYSDKQGNEGIMEAVNNALVKRLTDLDYTKAEKVYCNVLLKRSAISYEVEEAKGAIRKSFPKADMIIQFFYLNDIENEVMAVFLVMNAPKRIPTIDELGMDVIN